MIWHSFAQCLGTYALITRYPSAAWNASDGWVAKPTPLRRLAFGFEADLIRFGAFARLVQVDG